ncbi:MAG: conjugal transfer protein TrbI [Synechococcus sp. WH 8007]|nr:conjugal transfer protein TrbI [Synechococcus sp. WH 8007]
MPAVVTKCACPTCKCEVPDVDAVVRNGLSYCSEPCASGHLNNEPCHPTGACGCDCGG